jgi:hypothetical protein
MAAGNIPTEKPYMLHLVLRDGFRGHAVVVTMNDRIVYHATSVTTDGRTARADAVDVPSMVPIGRLAVAVTPGSLASTVDIDLAKHPHIAISLVGAGTLAFERSSIPFR